MAPDGVGAQHFLPCFFHEMLYPPHLRSVCFPSAPAYGCCRMVRSSRSLQGFVVANEGEQVVRHPRHFSEFVAPNKDIAGRSQSSEIRKSSVEGRGSHRAMGLCRHNGMVLQHHPLRRCKCQEYSSTCHSSIECCSNTMNEEVPSIQMSPRHRTATLFRGPHF